SIKFFPCVITVIIPSVNISLFRILFFEVPTGIEISSSFVHFQEVGISNGIFSELITDKFNFFLPNFCFSFFTFIISVSTDSSFGFCDTNFPCIAYCRIELLKSCAFMIFHPVLTEYPLIYCLYAYLIGLSLLDNFQLIRLVQGWFPLLWGIHKDRGYNYLQ